MIEDIYDPLDEYVNTFCPRFEQVSKDTFAQLAKEAMIDIEANRQTCKSLYDTQDAIANVKSRIAWTTFFFVLLCGCIVIGGIVLYLKYKDLTPIAIGTVVVVILVSLSLLFLKIHPCLRKLRAERENLQQMASQYEEEAWQQMLPLNRLYDWDVLTRMMTKVVPRLEFDPYFTVQRLADLKQIYGWDDSFNTERSVIYSHSGLINGNPFVLCRTRKMEMGVKTYYGSKDIHWTTCERGSDGKMQTLHHSETLTASVTAPYPEYNEKTRLIYGNTSAPDLKFYRKKSDLASHEGSLSYNWHKRKLRNKARDLSGSDFAMLTNEDFEVAFDTSNRNNNQQFALLFTPLAQTTMLKLLKDKEIGYGDDFDFDKNCMINTVIPDHIQTLDLDMDPSQYHNFDYDKAEADFYEINARYFRAIYFSLAPLLCIPMYQQIRSQQDIYGRDMQCHSAFWEHEALANFWGQDKFKHPQCVTDSILKTRECKQGDGSTILEVFAHGYRSVKRLTYVSRRGGDGRYHQVPVYWNEFLPVTGKGSIRMTEDNNFDNTEATQEQRITHIESILKGADLDMYRRHIASKVL